MAYAARTTVAVSRTRQEIEHLLTKHKAKRFAVAVERDQGGITFDLSDRRIRIKIRLPGTDQGDRSRWRALLLTIKAKIESVESGIETFDEAFLAHTVMPDGKTVAEHALPAIAIAYQGKEMPPLIPHDSPGDRK